MEKNKDEEGGRGGEKTERWRGQRTKNKTKQKIKVEVTVRKVGEGRKKQN